RRHSPRRPSSGRRLGLGLAVQVEPALSAQERIALPSRTSGENRPGAAQEPMTRLPKYKRARRIPAMLAQLHPPDCAAALIVRISAATCVFRFLRHHARRPPHAKIRPGNPAPAIGPGTEASFTVTVTPAVALLTTRGRALTRARELASFVTDQKEG